MPRTARASVGDVVYHVINRGNARAEVFHKDDDYKAFEVIIGQAVERLPMRVLGYCLMPNHFHLVLRPHHDGDLSRWMQWLMTSHVRRYHRHYQTCGHVWQGRFKAFPIQEDEHLLMVLRYVERNALRAGLVKRADDWPWGSLCHWNNGSRPAWLSDWPIERPRRWRWWVNEPQSDDDTAVIRNSIARGAPLGQDTWARQMAGRLGLESTLKPRGRPRKG